ncbi:MAG: hypothetical protein JXA60_01045 [Candidatus Coatesbacteria bacterium]|nr:hypothetical protein [Candidatus Coatesbacteria bacterium]
MKIAFEADNKMVYILLGLVGVLLLLNLISPLFNSKQLTANGVPDEPAPKVRVFRAPEKAFAINLNEYPNVHIFKMDGDQLHCLGMLKVDEKKRTYLFESYSEEGGEKTAKKK